ncbi:MAG TPA: hypothetical protein VEB20_20020 [Azospirillaceae bacterium]|nr:hypothetical protein [Azospirillaceae bacterium]
MTVLMHAAAETAAPRRTLVPFKIQVAVDAALGVDLLLFAGWLAPRLFADPGAFPAEALLRWGGLALVLLSVEAMALLMRPDLRLARWLLGTYPALNAACALALFGVAVALPGLFTPFGLAMVLAMALVSGWVAWSQRRALAA